MEKDGENYEISDLIVKLINSYNGMMNVINNISGIMNKTKMLSLNSSIEASRAGVAGKGFAVIASEINNFSKMSQDATNEGRKFMKSLNEDINKVVGLRTADVAYDLIDKIDRNIYERKCDVLIWAHIPFIKEFVVEYSELNKNKVDEYLTRVVDAIDAYADIIIVNNEGEMIYSVKHKDLINNYNVSHLDWFKQTMRKGECQISDMYYNEILKIHTMAFSNPIKNSDGKISGVIYSILNWNVINDIMDTAKVGKEGSVYLVNNDGLVIYSREKEEVLKKNLTEYYSAAREVTDGKEYGYEVEMLSGEMDAILGYAHSKGFSHYEGKNWSVVIREVF